MPTPNTGARRFRYGWGHTGLGPLYIAHNVNGVFVMHEGIAREFLANY
jgi:hypothetical protein